MSANRFERVRQAIVERQPMSPPQYFDFLVGADVRAAFLGRPIQTLQDDVDFWAATGAGLYPVRFGLLQFGGAGATAGHAHYSVYHDEDVEMNWAATERGVICSEKEFEEFPWPDPARVDLSVLDQVQPLLPEGMRVLANIGKIFTGVWQLMGFTTFAEALTDQPALVGRLFERVAAIQARITERVLAHPAVGAVIHADDLAYFSGPMIDPAVYRRYLFPVYRRLGDLCRQRGLIYIFHSDGRVTDLIADIVDCGFHALHPLEPKPMDAVAVKRQWGDRLCLLGHIDVDLLARGTPQQVREQTQRNLGRLARDGGYCPGSANSVPDYVPVANYRAMLEAIHAWR